MTDRRRQAAQAAEALPELARRAIGELLEQLGLLDARIASYDRESDAQARLCEPARRLMQIRGIGHTTALAIVATVGDAREFKNGRQFAVWIGLVSSQYSTGGEPRLGHSASVATPTFAASLCKARARCCTAPPGARVACHAGP